MSAIYFHSQSEDTVRLNGSERAYMSGLIHNVFWTSFQPVIEYGDIRHWSRQVLPKDCYVLKEYVGKLSYENTLNTFIGANGTKNLFWQGEAIELFALCLNTAYILGGDTMKLICRLHGQSEIHCYVEGANRKWLADIMAQGRELSILREDEGWEDVIELLRKRDDEPVVCSYSVCESFPNPNASDWEHAESLDEDEDEDEDNKYEAWGKLSDDEQWASGMSYLRRSIGLEIRPDDWSEFHYSTGPNDANWNGFSLRKAVTDFKKENK